MTAKKPSAPTAAKVPADAGKPVKGAAKPPAAAEAKPAKPLVKAAPPKATAKTEAKTEAKPAKAALAAKSAPPPAKKAAKPEPKPAKGGKKGAEAKAAPAADDVDLADIEAEFGADAEVEVEAGAEGEKAVKAKPLRMKVSRAKERALMREFGLEETTLTEEEATKRRQELKTLIKMGKTRGFLTHQEINDHLPEKLINEEILEAIISMLNDMGIAVYEQAP
ncbi:MAG: RNA polymerase sigma factor region1.1 domain-containing protein, partial [Burkholderiales bacterium]|nr:RNA polymerase sigma factor region1.1 domain-containing protein [Burkholderiales bacterium]